MMVQQSIGSPFARQGPAQKLTQRRKSVPNVKNLSLSQLHYPKRSGDDNKIPRTIAVVFPPALRPVVLLKLLVQAPWVACGP